MSDLLNKIYRNVLVYEEDIVKRNRQVDELLKQLTEPYKEKLTERGDEFHPGASD